MTLDWDSVAAHALSLPDTDMATSHGSLAVRVNGRAFVMTGHEPGSFCLSLDLDLIATLTYTDPATFWQTPHYAGWTACLVRYDSPTPDRVRAMIARSHDWNAGRPSPRPRILKA